MSSYSIHTLRPALSVTDAEREQLRVIAMDARDRIARLLEANAVGVGADETLKN